MHMYKRWWVCRTSVLARFVTSVYSNICIIGGGYNKREGTFIAGLAYNARVHVHINRSVVQYFPPLPLSPLTTPAQKPAAAGGLFGDVMDDEWASSSGVVSSSGMFTYMMYLYGGVGRRG